MQMKLFAKPSTRRTSQNNGHAHNHVLKDKRSISKSAATNILIEIFFDCYQQQIILNIFCNK